MGNFDTVAAVTANLEQVLKEQGAKFTQDTFEDITKVPASLFPHGRIFYLGQIYDQEHGQRPSWNEIKFKIEVIFKDTSSKAIIRSQQDWDARIRDNVTVNALNINDLSSSKLVSWVRTEEVDPENTVDRSTTEHFVFIRYREL